MPGTTSLHLDTISWTLQNVQVKGIFPVFIGGLSEESQHDEGENQSDDVHVSPLLSGGVFVLVVGRIGVLLYMIKILKEARLVNQRLFELSTLANEMETCKGESLWSLWYLSRTSKILEDRRVTHSVI